ncbi:hypothetical protein QFC20_003945 [Naganishia adeliensis]|uniref:Uncharacterized protein n=1 Tax=Naganishia adeliensis TaxID=92952 RepID=A0ACC2W7A7_9TREE|nr:hypothetical protein QFC20_003945 [Naganishia adeliensis]
MSTSISGYTASGHGHPPAPRFYQSKSILDNQVRPSTGYRVVERKMPPTEFATYAKAHAYPNGIPTKSSTFAVPEPRVMSSEPSISPRTSNLSPALQAAAAQALPPFSLYANKIPPIAETRPSTAIAAAHHLPGPQRLIESTAPKVLKHGEVTVLAFGSTTKIVPLPVTTTRPLPLVDRPRRVTKPPVILTAEEYSLRPSVGRYPGSSYTASQQWMDMDLTSSGNHGAPSATYVSDYTFPPRAQPAARSNINHHLGPFDIPPGFTSISHEPSSQKAPIVSQGASRQNGNNGGSKYDVAPFRLIDLQNSVVNVSGVSDLAKRPRGRPPAVKGKKQRIVEPAPSCDMTDGESETSADSSVITPHETGKEENTVERPEICSLNPAHPLYRERLERGEITDEVICNKRFTRRSDCNRHERIHVNDRPYACTVLGCGKSFIQRSALSVHEKTHTGDQPHLCDVCLKKFTDSSSLARHRRVHTEDKPYHCSASDCRQSFTRKLSLSRHFRSCHSELPVPEDLSFISRTRKQDDGVVNSVAQALRSMRRDVEESDSGLTELSDSSEEKDSTSSNRVDKESVKDDDKLVKHYEDTIFEGKEVIVYRPKANQDDEKGPGATAKHIKNDPPAIAKQKRKYDSIDSSEAPRNAKAPRTLSPRYMISPPMPAGLVTNPSYPTPHYKPPHNDRRQHDKRVRPYVQTAFARDEIAMPFDAIYGLANPRSSRQRGVRTHQPNRPAAHHMSFHGQPQMQSRPPGKPSQPQVFYQPVSTRGPNGPTVMMHPVFPNPHMAPTNSNFDKKPLVVETGRSRLLGYRLTPSDTETAHTAQQAVSEKLTTCPVEHKKTTSRPPVFEAVPDDNAMDVDQKATHPSTNDDTNMKRLRPLEIPPAKPVVLCHNAGHQGIRSPNES